MFLRRAIRRYAAAVLYGGLVLLGGRPAQAAAELAASIEYEFVAQPAGLPDEFRADEGTSLRFLAIKTIDGYRMEAALWQPERRPPADTTLVVMAPGDNNFHSPPQSTLGRGLAARGFAALAVNTRTHDGNIYSEGFHDLRRDIDAAVHTARALGYRALVLQGHSQGTLHVEFYAATSWDADIRGVVLLGPLANLPWKTRNILVQDEENFRALIDASMAALRARTPSAVLPVKMHSFTGHEASVTARHFLTYRWEATSIADGTYWIKRIPAPVLVVRDQADGFIAPFEPYMLLAAAHAEGSLVTSIKYLQLPDAKPPGPKGHYFIGNEQPLVDAVASWLAEQRL
jgi:pimeloyl-ACP methyl ester carboxylesterase